VRTASLNDDAHFTALLRRSGWIASRESRIDGRRRWRISGLSAAWSSPAAADDESSTRESSSSKTRRRRRITRDDALRVEPSIWGRRLLARRPEAVDSFATCCDDQLESIDASGASSGCAAHSLNSTDSRWNTTFISQLKSVRGLSWRRDSTPTKTTRTVRMKIGDDADHR